MTALIEHLIDGKSYRQGGREGDVYNPATGEISARVAFASPAVVDAAVGSAKVAFEEWRDTALTKRAGVMFRYRDLLDDHRDDLARIIVTEHGKVLSDAHGEIERGLEVVEFASGIPHLLKGEFSDNVSTDVDTYSLRQPLGVVAGITPFNFPAMVPMWMFPIAIACGNAFVLKPSEKDPSASNFLAELFLEAGLPPGVLNVVHGDKLAVDALLEHPDVAAISSVGSTPVARYIYATAARHGKRVQALGGAKNHMVVLPDADFDLAADALVGAAYGSTGQRCMAISAAVGIDGASDELLARVGDRVSGLRIGPGLEEASDMGPLVTGEHRDKVLGYVEAGIGEGAELAIDGRGVKDEHEEGFFMGPCVFDRVTTDMSIYKDEIFGPVLVMLRAASYEEAVAIINGNPYGNGTALFTKDGAAARNFQRDVRVGMVGINVPIPVPLGFYSFGGWNDSLFGASGMYGMEGVRFYTALKTVTSRWPQVRSGVLMGFSHNRTPDDHLRPPS
jgi:malonate-semialdehyde dehydrogenase (acetylating)/methylmalonate-semialdehyde dehydrogenase